MSVDLSRVKLELKKLSGPASISMGAEGIYFAIKKVFKTFEDDDDFKKNLDVKSKKQKKIKKQAARLGRKIKQQGVK